MPALIDSIAVLVSDRILRLSLENVTLWDNAESMRTSFEMHSTIFVNPFAAALPENKIVNELEAACMEVHFGKR